MDDYRHPVRGKLHINFRVIRTTFSRGPKGGKRVLRLVNATPVANHCRRVDKIRRGAPREHPNARPQAEQKGRDPHSPPFPLGQKSLAQASKPPAEDFCQQGGISLPSRGRRNAELPLGIHHSQKQPHKKGHSHRIQKGPHHPVGKVNGKGLGIEKIAEKGCIKVNQPQAVAPPILGNAGEHPQPQHDSSHHGRASPIQAAVSPERAAPYLQAPLGRREEALPAQSHKEGHKQEQQGQEV